MVTVLSLKVFKGPIAVLLTAVFLSMVIQALGNFG
jgi:hypothetical protein